MSERCPPAVHSLAVSFYKMRASSSKAYSRAYQRRRVGCLIETILSGTRPSALPEPLADVPALYKVYVVLVVTARPHQHTQEVQIVTQVFNERGPHTAE